jgi:transposase
LFSDTVKGAVASANLFSIVESAKANGVEPHAYLSRLFQQLPHAKTVEDFEALLPWNVCLPATP